MSDVDTGVGPSLSAEEDAYFATGGESPISDTGSDDAGSVTSTGGDNPDGGNKSADPGVSEIAGLERNLRPMRQLGKAPGQNRCRCQMGRCSIVIAWVAVAAFLFIA